MTKEIRITVTAPIECTDEQFKEWAEFNLHARADCSMSNPLHEYDLEVDDMDID